jgi:2,3-diketo-5-methylthio-1-phosphopentane phosphatase
MATNRRLILVLDFDGTVTRKDIGDEVCERFATPEWKQIDDLWVRNEITLAEAQRRMWGLTRATREQAIAFVREVGELRAGLDGLFAAVQQVGGAVWLASGGFDFYIEALLGERLARFERAWFNKAEFASGGIDVSFPHVDFTCARVPVCKGRICDLARESAERVIFVGDGASDRCAVGHADLLFAVRDGLLARHCDAESVAYRPFDTFDDIVPHL